jgi:putative ABC transport system ATP-binding protein
MLKKEEKKINPLMNFEAKPGLVLEKENMKLADKPSKKTVIDKNISEARGKPLIELKHVNKIFKVGKNDVHVLKDVNIKIYPQEFIVILGPSGSGKSTLLNSILGLEYPTSGEVNIMGTDITKLSQNEIARFRFKVYGIVFQRADWVRSVSVIQNIAMPLAINNQSGKKRMDIAWRLIKEVGMSDHSNFFPSELSGGQQQKICLARSLVNDPPIVIADEPTGNLDTVSAEKVMNLFVDLNEKKKKTLIMVTHNIDYVRYASRTIYVRDGRVVESSEHFGA